MTSTSRGKKTTVVRKSTKNSKTLKKHGKRFFLTAGSVLKWVLYLAPSFCLIGYIIAPGVQSFAGVFGFYQMEKPVLLHEEDHRKIQRHVQQFFLQYDTSIDLSDIIDARSLRKNGYLKFKPQGCLQADVVAFVPLKFRLPYVGVKTYEYCLVIKP